MKKLTGSRVIIVIVVVVALLGGTVAGGFLLPLLSASVAPAVALGAGVRPAAGTPVAKPTSVEPGLMYPMQERIINLADTSGLRYLKIDIVLEFDVPDARGLTGDAYKKRQDDLIKEMASRQPIMDDIVTTVLSSKTVAALTTPEGKDALREELKIRLGEVAAEHKLLNVYFTQFIIQ